MINLLFTILQCTPAGGDQKGGGTGYTTILMFAMLIVVFYFFFIRPQTKKTKELKKYRESLQKGDKVVTIGGIHGKISEIRETTFVLELIDKTRVEVERASVSNDATASQEQMKARN